MLSTISNSPTHPAPTTPQIRRWRQHLANARAEDRSPYDLDPHATATMAADERIHWEVVRGLAARGRNRLAGSFRAAVFGANDGLGSDLCLMLGAGASGVATPIILLTGLAGLLAGALSMGAGKYVSVRSRGMNPEEAHAHAVHVLNGNWERGSEATTTWTTPEIDEYEAVGTGAIVGLLSGPSPIKLGRRQLMIGFGAAGAAYLLGLLFGTGTA